MSHSPQPTDPPDVLDVLVVDDQRTFADALALALDIQPGLRCAEPVSSAEEALERVGEACPDVILLDVNLPGIDGITAIGHLREQCPGVRLVVITADLRGETLLAAADAGADALLPKDHPFQDVVRAVSGRGLEAPPAAGRTLTPLVEHARTTSPTPDPPGPTLTDRESQILSLLADGVAVKQIARELDMSINTCRGHVSALLSKLGVHSQLAAVVKAARLGLLTTLRPGP